MAAWRNSRLASLKKMFRDPECGGRTRSGHHSKSNQMKSFVEYLKENEEKQVIEEMARLGYIDGKKFEIIVFTDDPGNKPHFHVRDAATKGSTFHSCVEIRNARYFKHFGKTDILNGKMKKKLVDFFNASSEDFEDMNNWKVLLRMWNSNNSSMKVPPNQEMPDYMKL